VRVCVRERVCMCVNVCGSPRKKGKLEKKWEYPENKKRFPGKVCGVPGKRKYGGRTKHSKEKQSELKNKKNKEKLEEKQNTARKSIQKMSGK